MRVRIIEPEAHSMGPAPSHTAQDPAYIDADTGELVTAELIAIDTASAAPHEAPTESPPNSPTSGTAYATKSIKEWLAEDRPREKLQERGKGALTDAELLAILLGSGTTELSAVDLAREVLEAFQGLAQLSQAGVDELTQIKGIGPAKAISIVSAFELAKRRAAMGYAQMSFADYTTAGNYLQHKIGNEPHEVFYVLYLNNANKLIAEGQIGEGGIGATHVDPRRVFRKALTHRATKIIVSHNHPSGQTEPSDADLKLTNKLIAGGSTLDIEIVDHVIATSNSYLSFAAEGYI